MKNSTVTKKKARNKKIRSILIVILIVQLVFLLFKDPYFWGENALTVFVAEVKEKIGDFFEPDGSQMTWKNLLWQVQQSGVYRTLGSVLRWVIPIMLGANIAEAVLMEPLERLWFRIEHQNVYAGSGLLPEHKKAAIKAFNARPKGPVIDFNNLCAFRFRAYGEHERDVQGLLAEDEAKTILDGYDEPAKLLKRGGDVFYISSTEEEIPIHNGELLVSRRNTAGSEVVSELITLF